MLPQRKILFLYLFLYEKSIIEGSWDIYLDDVQILHPYDIA